MINVKVNTNTGRETYTKEITDTPASLIQEAEISIAGAQLNLDGVILYATDLQSTFEALGVKDGTTVNFNSVIKADGGEHFCNG